MRPIRQVFDTLVSGFHNVQLSSGQLITSSSNKNESAPSMLWKWNGWNSEVWQPYMVRYDWDIPVTFMLQAEPGNSDPVLDALDDIYAWADYIYGLPIDVNGQLVPYGPVQLELRRLGELYTIADRFVGPYVKSARPRPNDADNTFTIVDLVFHVEFVVDNTPSASANAAIFTLGLNLNGGSVIRDPSKPFGYPTPAQNDTRSQGAYSTPDTTLRINGQTVKAQFPPIVNNLPAVLGPNPATTLAQIQIVPAAVTVTSTQQLQAIGVYVDGGTINLTANCSWSSSATGVATCVAGLVTKVSVGTATVTASYNGFSATSAITTA